jgi:hypothetical protein
MQLPTHEADENDIESSDTLIAIGEMSRQVHALLLDPHYSLPYDDCMKRGRKLIMYRKHASAQFEPCVIQQHFQQAVSRPWCITWRPLRNIG